ncbi:MAG: F0F1 ATP synthase subunit B [Actinomycetota bacterium]|nr:F0F1 ATP synthase subunit B [Actinomycetota bacterium]
MYSMLTTVILFAQEAPPPAEEKTTNPILPAGNEIIWGAISFLVLFFLIAKFAFPAVKKGIDARADKIRSSLDEAEKTRDEANTILEDYRRQLADAKNESSRIIEEARQSADKLRQDLKKQAEAEVAEIKSRAQEDIAAQVDRAMGDLRSRVADMTIELTEKVVQRNLDRETNLALIERFIDEVDTTASAGHS